MRGLTGHRDPRGLRADEGGAVVVIMAIALIAIFGMLVLTVDVGGLLLRRRAMVNASDAAALAAARTCADISDTTFTPEWRADAYAASNQDGLLAQDGGVTEITGCYKGSGYLSVRYTTQQPLFFAGVLGFGPTGAVSANATAAWGPAGGAFALPIVLDSGYLQGVCKVPDGIQIDDTCAFWYDNGASLGNANWGYMNLDQWNVSSGTNCSNAGTSNRDNWIINGYPDIRTLNGNPPGTAPTYVCNDTGHSSADWKTLQDETGNVKYFPVNDCSGQLAKGGGVSPCPSTPDKYDIIGFTKLLVSAVYKGNDALAIGTPGASGKCTLTTTSLTTGQVKNLADSYGVNGCPSSPDTISAVRISPKKGADFNQCVPGDISASCAYWYDPAARQITWRTTNKANLKIQYDWSMNGTPGACGIHPSDPNAICLVTQWKGFSTGPAPIGGGKDFGVGSVALCDRTYKTCPGQ